MKLVLPFVIAHLTVIVAPSFADGLRLEGEAFRPKSRVVWAATNALPRSLEVYKVAPQVFSKTVISNAMLIGSFTLPNKISTPAKGLIQFQDRRDINEMTRFLKLSPSQGWMSYYDGHADASPVHGVPAFEEVERLAVGYLSRLGGDTNQVVPRPWPRTQTEVTSFEKKGGPETGRSMSMRGIFLFRQIDGIEITGNSFWIDFCNDAKPSLFELTWPKLQALQSFKTAKPDEIIAWVKSGRAVNPNPDASIVLDAPLTITRITPYYLGKVGPELQEIIYPFAKLDVTANVGNTNLVVFILHCPIIDNSKSP